jgi:hypothetical protein|tara:strand:- start:834 stop:1031 length:198 start_codon:yes stop_codon:yes gene_type:complete
MDGIDIVQFVRKTLLDRKGQISELMSEGGVKDMEHYRECMGEIRNCDYVLVELSEMLDKQEYMDV